MPQPLIQPSQPPKHDPYAALRNRSYLLYSMGWVAAVVGHQMTSVALGWDIYQRTKDPMSLGWVGLVQAIPVILLALPAGQIADRFDRRKVVMMTQLLVAACAVGLAYVSYTKGSIGAMYGIIGVAAVAAAIGGPARSALPPQILPNQLLPNAYTWNSSFFQIAAVLGPAAGGLLISVSVPLIYLLDAALAVVFAVNLLFVKVRPLERQREPANLRTLTEGLRFVWKNQIILATLSLDLFAVLLGGAVYLLPVFAQLLDVGGLGFGWLRAAPAIGAFAMALLLAHLPPMKNAGRAMLLAVAGFGLATIIFGLTPVLRTTLLNHAPHSLLARPFLGAHLWYWIALFALLLTGAFDNISVVVRHTLVQVLAPDAMRGRISAVNNVFIGASNELGGFESGLTARLFGPIASVVGGGIGTILVVTATAWKWPALRGFGSLHDAKPIEHKT